MASKNSFAFPAALAPQSQATAAAAAPAPPMRKMVNRQATRRTVADLIARDPAISVLPLVSDAVDTVVPEPRSGAAPVFPVTGAGPALVLGGVLADVRTAADVVAVIADFATGTKSGQLAVASVNLDHIHHFGRDPLWRSVFAGGSPTEPAASGIEWLNLIDGVPTVRQAERLNGNPVDKLSGSDLIGPVLDLVAGRHLRLAFLGGTAETHRRLQTRWAFERPDIEVVGWWSPERGDLADPVAAALLEEEIRDAHVDVLIVGLGKPRQEKWIADHGVLCGARSMLAFGAVVDFLAGNVKRAPLWVSARGLEWAWRLVQEPRRLTRRYLVQGPPAYWRLRRSSYLLPVPDHRI